MKWHGEILAASRWPGTRRLDRRYTSDPGSVYRNMLIADARRWKLWQVGRGDEIMPRIHLMPPTPSDLSPAEDTRSVPSRQISPWRLDLKHDRLLLSLVVACSLLLGFQLLIILLQPPWIGPVTDWLRAVLAWPELLLTGGISLWLSRRHRPEAVSWWLISGGALCYAIARTWWTIDDVLIYHHGVPFPIAPDLFFALQYPFYFLAVILIPFDGFWGPRLLALLDALILMLAAAAISWYFLLAPLFAASGMSPLAKAVSVGYPVADLFLLLALMLILVRPLRYDEDRPVVGLIAIAVACLIIADAGTIFLVLHPAHEYHTGSLPDFFWLASDLLIPIAAVIQVRVVQRVQVTGAEGERFSGSDPEQALGVQRLNEEDIRAALRIFLPLVAALLASGALLLRAAADAAPRADWEHLIIPLAIITGLLLLVIVRQVVTFLEMTQLGHALAAARAEQQARRDLDRRKDEFLSVVSHELRTPLAGLELFFALLERRLDTILPPVPVAENGASQTQGQGREAKRPVGTGTSTTALRTALVYCQENVKRLVRLANDLVDDSRVLHGRLSMKMQPCDLRALVQVAVEEQRAAVPERTIRLELPSDGAPVPVRADADRIRQVVTNYLTNALKYSRLEQPVTIRVEVVKSQGMEDMDSNNPRQVDGRHGELADMARVSVQDEGIGVPVGEQRQIWERFHVVEENRIQSGSGISLGLGLHISKAIIEEHHGHVGLNSIPGQGATFWFTLPLVPSL